MITSTSFQRILLVLALSQVAWSATALTARYRCMWRSDPATTMVIGWDQVSGSDPIFYYDTQERGQDPRGYRHSRRADKVVPARGMNTHFVRLSGLRPNTLYHFIIRDSEGYSRRMSFQTAPVDPAVRLSIIAGGDSRNYREGRLNANLLVSKLRPHFVMFGGDFTDEDTAEEWRDWLDDWQVSIGSDGRLCPIVVTRGNHELSGAPLVEIFDLPYYDSYYALTFGGSLLRVYTLNTLIASGGEQRSWLEHDLQSNQSVSWRIAQYHHPMRPHTARKAEKDELVANWAPLFRQYKLKLAIECDAHVVKHTWPIRPSNEPGSYEGFIRDDAAGTVYVGEGCWGAPLRSNNDDKPWTRSSGSFNQVKWIFVDRQKIEVRTVKTDGAGAVGNIHPARLFEPPLGLVLWNPPNGDVVTISKSEVRSPKSEAGSSVSSGN